MHCRATSRMLRTLLHVVIGKFPISTLSKTKMERIALQFAHDTTTKHPKVPDSNSRADLKANIHKAMLIYYIFFFKWFQCLPRVINPTEIKAYARLLHMDRNTPYIHSGILYMLGFHWIPWVGSWAFFCACMPNGCIEKISINFQ